MANVNEYSQFIIQVEDEDGDDWHDAHLPIRDKKTALTVLRDYKKTHRKEKYHLIERTTITVDHIIS